MTTNTLPFPTLLSTPLSTSHPGASAPRVLPAPWLGPGTLERWRQRSSEAISRLSFERKMRKAAATGVPLRFGSLRKPYDPEVDEDLWEIASLWNCPESLGLQITTGSPSLLRGLQALARLDRWHAVAIDMIVPCRDPLLTWRFEPETACPDDRLEAVSRLAEEGLATRLIIPIPMDAQPSMNGNDLTPPEEALELVVRAALAAGAHDVMALPLPIGRERITESGQARIASWQTSLHRLRLRFGLPRHNLGRG